MKLPIPAFDGDMNYNFDVDGKGLSLFAVDSASLFDERKLASHARIRQMGMQVRDLTLLTRQIIKYTLQSVYLTKTGVHMRASAKELGLNRTN